MGSTFGLPPCLFVWKEISNGKQRSDLEDRVYILPPFFLSDAPVHLYLCNSRRFFALNSQITTKCRTQRDISLGRGTLELPPCLFVRKEISNGKQRSRLETLKTEFTFFLHSFSPTLPFISISDFPPTPRTRGRPSWKKGRGKLASFCEGTTTNSLFLPCLFLAGEEEHGGPVRRHRRPH